VISLHNGVRILKMDNHIHIEQTYVGDGGNENIANVNIVAKNIPKLIEALQYLQKEFDSTYHTELVTKSTFCSRNMAHKWSEI